MMPIRIPPQPRLLTPGTRRGDAFWMLQQQRRRRLRRPGEVDVLPIPAGATLAFDTTDPASLFSDTAGTVPISDPGDPVGYVRSLVGSGYLSAPTDGARPVWQDGVRLAYDGADDRMRTPLTLNLESAEEIWLIGTLSRIAGAEVWNTWNGANNNPRLRLIDNAAQLWPTSGTSRADVSYALPASPTVISYRANRTARTGRLWAAGSLIGTSSAVSGTEWFPNGPHQLIFGALRNGAGFGQITQGRVLLYLRPLSEDERLQAEAWVGGLT